MTAELEAAFSFRVGMRGCSLSGRGELSPCLPASAGGVGFLCPFVVSARGVFLHASVCRPFLADPARALRICGWSRIFVGFGVILVLGCSGSGSVLRVPALLDLGEIPCASYKWNLPLVLGLREFRVRFEGEESAE